MSTYTPKAGDITRTWHVIDATDVVLGRLAVQSATLLRGKHKPTYAPHIDGGDFVIVVNADKVAITGNKASGKMEVPPLRTPRWPQVHVAGRPARDQAGARRRAGHQGHAAEEQARSCHGLQAQGVRRPESSARGPAPRPLRDQAGGPVSDENVTEENIEVDAVEIATDDYTTESEAPAAPAVERAPVVIDHPIQTVGRRKEAVVRVRLVPGTGQFHLNGGRDLETYFPNKVHQQLVKSPLVTVDRTESFDIYARLGGGGPRVRPAPCVSRSPVR